MPFLVQPSRRKSQPWSEVSDRQLMAAIGRGENTAFDELIRRKSEPLIRTVTRITGDREEARDIAQVVFLRVWERRRTYDPRWSPNTWIYRIGVNLAIDLVRARRTRRQAIEPLGTHLRSVKRQETRGLADLQGREVSRIFEDLAAGLTEKQRWVFLLAGVEGLSSQEVGEILGCRPSTVRNHLLAARRQLRQELRRLYPEYAPPSVPADPAVEPES